MKPDPELLARLRAALADEKGVEERAMFGSVAFLVAGRMACGPHGDRLIVRIGEEAARRHVGRPGVSPMDFTGRVMRAFATIEPEALRTERQLTDWVAMAVAFARTDGVPRRATSKAPARSARATNRGRTRSTR